MNDREQMEEGRRNEREVKKKTEDRKKKGSRTPRAPIAVNYIGGTTSVFYLRGRLSRVKARVSLGQITAESLLH